MFLEERRQQILEYLDKNERVNGRGNNFAHGVLPLFAVIQSRVALRNTTYGPLRS